MKVWKGVLAMRIERKQLIDDLQDFAMHGDGVIIGGPGVGKSYVLKELRQYLKAAGITHLLLRIDQLGDGTTETLREELSYQGDLIEKLKSIPISGKNVILLFDAFDAARDEGTRNRFLNLIRRAIKELVKWNIVVTVRTYDAMKSQELLDLFGSPDGTEYQTNDILCRHFTIPSFTKDEILQVFNQIGRPKSIYNDGSQDFKDILATPFNLWLLEKILKSSNDIPDFSQIHSEVQLLGLFWQRRIRDETHEFLLEQTAHQMVEERSLSIKQSSVNQKLELEKPAKKAAWENLLSDEILAKVSSTGQRIAFSHNILFDYAVSVLLIDDEPQHLKEFITKDLSRPLFLRPSLTYFFTRLWYYEDSKYFWRAFWHILRSDQSVHLRLVARLIPTSVIANEAREIGQLTPLLQKLQSREPIADEAITRLLQSLQTLQIKREAPWIYFFDQASEDLHANFAWDLASLTLDILDQAIQTENKDMINICGRIGRQLFEWSWQERETSKDDWYNRFGGNRAVPLVAKTYSTNVAASQTLLKKVLGLTNEDNFPIGFLLRLTDHVDKIWTYDPNFVALIYLTVFTHYETSNEERNMGGFIAPITTFRNQDYSMCQYRLVKHFPNFLQAAPLPAVLVAIHSLNYFIRDAHIGKYFQEDTFSFHGKLSHFVQDNSYLWDQRKHHDEPIKMANALFEYISELAVSEDPLLDSVLEVFSDHVRVAFFWKRLLKTASQLPKVFAPRLFELCIAKPIQLSHETSYELGLFLKNAALEFTPDKLRQIEESILSLPREAKNEEDPDILKRLRNRLLVQIPDNLLSMDEGRKIREKMEHDNDVPVNRPPVTITTSSEDFTEGMWFQEKGIDTTTPENQKLQRFSESLEKFSSEWRNNVPTKEDTELILPKLREVYAAIKSKTKADEEVINLLWRKLTECAAILGKVADNLDNDSFTFCRQVLLEGAKHKLPEPDLKSDEQFNSPGYAPYPRHEAARGLLRFTFHQPDAEILDAIEELANDPVPSVRMVTAWTLFLVYRKSPERFWDIMNNRASRELNLIVQKFLYFSLSRVVTKENEDKITSVMAQLLEHTPITTEKLELSDSFIYLLMWLTIYSENSWAVKILNSTFYKNPIRFANPLARVVDQIMKDYVVPKNLETSDGRERIERAIKWVSKAITVASDGVTELCAILKEQRTEEIEKKLHDTYGVIDEVIARLYFEVAHARGGQSTERTQEISYELRCQFYNAVKPLMNQVINFAQDSENSLMFASTAHDFMQVLTSFLSCNPKEVLHLAEQVATSSERFGYTLDGLAVQDIVDFTEIVLADYRHVVQDDEESLESLLNLLDLFAKTGWSDALNLVWRLDEVFR